MGTSVIREAEHQIDVGLFLDEYPQWELGTPHQSVILHEMFLQATDRGQKEAECMFHQGCWGSSLGLNPQAGPSAMELVGYRTSRKEIRDIYQSVYLLQRLLGLPSCGNQLRRWTIQDIHSSLKDWMHMCGYPATTGEGSESEEEQQPRPNRQEPYEEALKMACQRALYTAKALQGDIERLSRRTRGRSWTPSWTCSQSCNRNHSRSRSRSHSRAHSQSHSQNGSQSRQPWSPDGPSPGRRVSFREPVAETNSEGNVEEHMA